MDNMWLTEDAFLDFDKKCIRFVNSNNKVVHEVPFPKGKKGEKAKLVILLEYLSRNRMRNRFEGEELIDVIWGKDNDGKDNTNLNRVLSDLRSLLNRNSESFMIPIGSSWEEREYLFYPPLDKLPPDDYKSDEPEQPEELPLDVLEVEESGRTEIQPTDELKAASIEATQCKNDCREALNTGLTIRIVLVCIVGILLNNLVPLVLKRDENGFVVIRPTVYRCIRYSIIFLMMVVVGGFFNNSYGQVIETLVLRIKRRSKYRTYHMASKALQESAIATRIVRIVYRIIVMAALVLLYVLISKQHDKYTGQFMHLSFPTSESSMILPDESAFEEVKVMFDEKKQPYGECGENLKWKIYNDGTMTISGEGEMYDFGWDTTKQAFTQPWFAYRNLITTVTIENGVSYIGHNAFDDCTELKTISIPNSVRAMRWETGVFDLCTNLEKITVDTDNEYFTSLDGVLFDKEMKVLIKYPAKKPGSQYEIPDTVVEITADCFESSNLEIISIPNNVDLIQKYAFSNLKSVDIVVLPYNLRIIEEGLFYESSIKSVVIPENVSCIKDSAFLGCAFLTDIYYTGTPEQWEHIGILDNNDGIYGARIHCNFE